MDPPTIASSFRGNGASCGPTLPNNQSVVYIVPIILAVTIAMSTLYIATDIMRNESNNPPRVLFVSNYYDYLASRVVPITLLVVK